MNRRQPGFYERLKRAVSPRAPEEPLGKMLRHELPFLLLIALATLGLEQLNILRGFETYALDAFLLLNPHEQNPKIVIVTIDEQDYSECFQNHSPLDPDEISMLISKIAEARPRVIAVDLDTSQVAPAHDGPWPVEVVWGRDGHYLANLAEKESPFFQSERPIVPEPFCAGKFEERVERGRLVTTPHSGLVVFPKDFDGVVRRYEPSYRAVTLGSQKPSEVWIDTLPRVVAQRYAATIKEPKTEEEKAVVERVEHNRESGREVLMNFADYKDRYQHIPLHVLYEAKNWEKHSAATDAVVLIGGAFHAGRDDYATPVGQRFGVELHAMAIDVELFGGGIKEWHRLVVTLLDVVAGVLFIYLNWRFPGGRGAWISLVAIFLLPPLISFLLFRTMAFWFNSVAVLVGLWIHLLWKQSQERRALREEVEALRAHKKAFGR